MKYKNTTNLSLIYALASNWCTHIRQIHLLNIVLNLVNNNIHRNWLKYWYDFTNHSLNWAFYRIHLKRIVKISVAQVISLDYCVRDPFIRITLSSVHIQKIRHNSKLCNNDSLTYIQTSIIQHGHILLTCTKCNTLIG